ncbi:hypothetical protein SAMN04324257_00169 [Thermoanaerobacter thermohydrosulfuricus]|nr:hypothetical protein SAMN04324257_00169 [Thermoanaerobacter thermohydrosulfuricus]
MKELKRYTGRGSSLRIDLKEWQDIGELPEFRGNPFLPIRSIPPEVRQFIDISDISPSGVRIKAKNYVGILPLSEEIILTVNPKAPIEDFLYILYKAQGRKVSVEELKKWCMLEEDMRENIPIFFIF